MFCSFYLVTSYFGISIMSGQLRRMDEIESWRQKAYVLSRSDRLGTLVMKSLDLIQTVQRDGIGAENLPWYVQSLARERVKTMNDDLNRDDEVRALMYGMSGAIGSMVESIVERRETETVVSPDNHIHHVESCHAGSVLPYHDIIKTENTDVAMDYFTADATVDSIGDADSIRELPGISAPARVERSNEAAAASTTALSSGSSAVTVLARVSAHAAASPATFGCSTCNKTFGSHRALRSHAIVHKDIRCQTCGAKMKDHRALLIHTKLRHPGNGVSVGKDDNTKRATSISRSNGATAAASEKLNCSQCSKTFSSTKSLKCHEDFHNGIKCTECGVIIMSSSSLYKHFSDTHPGVTVREKYGEKKREDREDKKWKITKCTECSMILRSRAYFIAHMRTHTGEKPFTCDKCPSAFTSTSFLNGHLREKHGEKPYECLPCGVKFGRRNELREHNTAVGHNRKQNFL